MRMLSYGQHTGWYQVVEALVSVVMHGNNRPLTSDVYLTFRCNFLQSINKDAHMAVEQLQQLVISSIGWPIVHSCSKVLDFVSKHWKTDTYALHVSIDLKNYTQ